MRKLNIVQNRDGIIETVSWEHEHEHEHDIDIDTENRYCRRCLMSEKEILMDRGTRCSMAPPPEKSTGFTHAVLDLDTKRGFRF